jgi:nucleotidyltransferase substrate binding protein (TIGR01987 family)
MTLDLTPLERALAALQRGLLRWQSAPDDEELRDACIQRFEFTFELCWKMLKRRLELDLPNASEVDGMSYRVLMRAGAEQGLLSDVAPWWVYRDKRNITSHTYDAAKAMDVAGVLPDFARDAAALLAALQRRGVATGEEGTDA